MKKVITLLFLLPCLLHAETNPLPLGNLALPPSRQPGPLIGFGDNIIDEGEVVASVMVDRYSGNKNYSTDINPNVVYGISSDMSLYLSTAYAPRNKDRSQHSSGMEDSIAQLEYAYYSSAGPHFLDQATFVANVGIPTGSSSKTPSTGLGSTSFFLGATYNSTQTEWLYFTSQGVTVTTSRHHKKSGNQFLYQFGFGHNIPSPTDWIFAWMIEFDGQYSAKNSVRGHSDPNSGGNTIFMTPSLWISSKRSILQLGLGCPIIQHLHGHQSKKQYSVVFSFGISI
ncbi:MAG: hypothetical protein JSS12_02760 [Verrucomicrobia bacterium]|nr:hypothetical protein [Verrucomicrobiota bacterium]